MKVYTKRFETVLAYSTARKCLESLTGNFVVHVEDFKISHIEITEKTIAKLITVFNKRGFMTVVCSEDDHDQIHLEVCEVR